jgi:flagellar motor switch protein FliG
MSEAVGMYHPGVVGGALRKGLQQAQQQGAVRISQLDGPLRAAIVLLSLGTEQAAELIKSFSPAEAQRVSSLVAAVRSLNREMLIEVLEDFKNVTEHAQQVAFDPQLFIQTLATKFASQGEGANPLADNLAQNVPALEMLIVQDPEVLHAHLKDEHPQVVAILLALMPAEVSASVLEQFDEVHREELLLRMAVLDRVDPSALVELNEMLESHLNESSGAGLSKMGGSRTVAEILSMFSDQAGRPILKKIREHDSQLAEQIVKRMFSFEDFAKIDSQALQRLLAEVPSDVLVVALKGANPSLKDFFFANMTKRLAERVKFDMESLPPVRVQEVEAKQREMVQIARSLQDKNLISLDRTGGSDML